MARATLGGHHCWASQYQPNLRAVRTVFIKEKTTPSSDPAAPPIKTTEIKTPEQVATENAGRLTEAPNGQVFETPRPDPACFTGDVLVLTNEGQTPILDVIPGAMVWSRSETTGETGYRPGGCAAHSHARTI